MTTTRHRLIAATLVVAERVGVARMTLEEVAAEAELSRQTVYRHFGSREGLLDAVVRSEAEKVSERVREAADAVVGSPAERIVAGLSTGLTCLRQHALLRRTLQLEPETLLPLLMAPGGPAVEIATAVAERLLEGVEVEPHARAVDVVARLLVSYSITPPDQDSEVVARELVQVAVGGLTSTSA